MGHNPTFLWRRLDSDEVHLARVPRHISIEHPRQRVAHWPYEYGAKSRRRGVITVLLTIRQHVWVESGYGLSIVEQLNFEGPIFHMNHLWIQVKALS